MKFYFLAPSNDLPVAFDNDSTFILALIVLGLALLMLGIFSKYKIFALLSVGIWLHLLLDIFELDPLIAISMAGLILFSGFIAFFGERND